MAGIGGLRVRGRAALLAGTALVGALGVANAAVAQSAANNGSTIDEVVVTAQKREQRLQDVPISITALTATELVANRVDNVRDLNGLAPNLTTRPSAGGSFIANYTIRGLFATGSAPGSDKGVSQYIDGVYLQNSGASIFDLADIQRIEVLKGPQGTLFGRNATGGAVTFYTRNPTGEFGGKQDFTVGNYGQFRSRTRIDLPALGPFSATLTYTHTERRGDTKNLGAGTVWDYGPATGGAIGKLTSPKRLGDQDVNAVFAAIRFAPNDKFEALYKFDYAKNKFTPDGTGLVATRTASLGPVLGGAFNASATPIGRTRPDAVNNWFSTPGHTTNYGHNLTMTYELTPHLTLKNILAYRHSDLFVANQLDGLGGVLLPVAPGVSVPFLGIDNSTVTKEHQWSDEFQVNYDTSWMVLTAGYLHFDDKVSTGGPPGAANTIIFSAVPGFVIPTTRSIPSTVHLKSDAGYAQGEFHLTPQIDAIGGVRYTKDVKNGFDRGGATPIPIVYSKSQVTYLVGVNYKPTEDVLTYIKYSTGYVSGGFLANNAYAPELARSLEGGVKSEWVENRLRANLAVFNVNYRNLQSVTSGATYCRIQPAVPCGSPQVVYNLGNATARGAELELTAKPMQGLTLQSGLGYTHFHISKLQPFLVSPQNPFTSTFIPTYRPKWTVNLAAQYDTGEVVAGAHATFRVDADYRSKSYTLSGGSTLAGVSDPGGIITATTIPGAWLVNGRIALVDIAFGHGLKGQIALWARNLFDNKDPTFTAYLGPFTGANYERARTFGLDLSAEF
jgi:iron complex outermembrane receptor protein